MKLKKFLVLAVGALLLSTGIASATMLSLGTIGVATGLGSAGDNNLIYVSNTTDSDCTLTQTYAAVCNGGIKISSWSITFDYTSLVGQAQVAQSPVTFSGGPDINPSNDWIDNPLYAALPYSDSANGVDCCLNIITKVVFSATLPTSFTIYDPSSQTESLFVPESPFTFTYTPSDAYLNALGSPNLDGVDLLVSNAVATAPLAPEPGTLLLFSGCLAALVLRRRSVRV